MATVIDDLEIRVDTKGLNELLKLLNAAEARFSAGRRSAEQFAAATSSVARRAEDAGRGAERGAGGMKTFFASIVRIAKYRLIRTAMKEMTTAFREGLNNAYEFSRGIGGELAAAMDELSVKSQTMRNQIGSAFGEVIINLMPILLRFVEIIRVAANAIAQFFAAFNGRSTYLKAVDATKRMEEASKGGAKAAKEWRNQLMGFDEINRLDDPNTGGGGGGGSVANDASNMFEVAGLDAWTERLEPIKAAFALLWEAVQEGAISSWNNIKNTIDVEKYCLDIIQTIQGLVEFVAGIFSGDWEAAFTGAARAIEGFGGIISQTLTFLGGLLDGFLRVLSGGVSGFFDWLYENTGIRLFGLKNLLVGVIDSVRILAAGLIADLQKILSGIVDFVAGAFTGDWARAWGGIKQIFAGLIQAIVDIFYGAVNFLISGWNSISGFFGDVVSWFGGEPKSRSVSLLSSPQIFATGGFPEDGFFFANHNELVGQFSNGSTAVANNEQIVDGIKRGVFEAVSSALSGQGERPVDVNVWLDGKQITSAISRGQRNVERATGRQYA